MSWKRPFGIAAFLGATWASAAIYEKPDQWDRFAAGALFAVVMALLSISAKGTK